MKLTTDNLRKHSPILENVLGSQTLYNVQLQIAIFARPLLREKLVGVVGQYLAPKGAMVKLVISLHSRSLQRTQRGNLGASWLESSETNALNTRCLRGFITRARDFLLGFGRREPRTRRHLAFSERREDAALFCKRKVLCLSALGSDKGLCEAHKRSRIQTTTTTPCRNIRKPENYR